jgi:hypothetical protein
MSKKILCVSLATLLILGMCVPALAAEGSTRIFSSTIMVDTGTDIISVSNVLYSQQEEIQNRRGEDISVEVLICAAPVVVTLLTTIPSFNVVPLSEDIPRESMTVERDDYEGFMIWLTREGSTYTLTHPGLYDAGWDTFIRIVDVPDSDPIPAPAPTPPAGISVTLNGVQVQFDQPPVIQDGRTLVPLRAIFEALGATVDWCGDTQTVTAVKDDITVSLQIGSNELIRNGENITLDVPAQLIGGRTVVPARAVAESFGADVEWDGNTQTVIITN